MDLAFKDKSKAGGGEGRNSIGLTPTKLEISPLQPTRMWLVRDNLPGG